jgi:hypothetical protein
VIARPPSTVPVPDAVALLAGRQLPPHVREAVAEAALCGRLLTSRTHAACHPYIRFEAAQYLHQRLRAANRTLAAHNPGCIVTWADMPGLNR